VGIIRALGCVHEARTQLLVLQPDPENKQLPFARGQRRDEEVNHSVALGLNDDM
jgi:hypothetical protein